MLGEDVALSGIGAIGNARRQARRDRRTERRSQRRSGTAKTGLGNFIKRQATNAKTAARAATKAVTAPARTAANLALRVMLPKAAPFFLYLFLPDDLPALPEVVKRKQGVAQRVAKFITDGIGMKESTLMGILRNGIMKEMGRTPEQILSAYTQEANVGAVTFAALIPLITTLISKISLSFGKNKVEVKPGDEPDPATDFKAVKDKNSTKDKDGFFSRAWDKAKGLIQQKASEVSPPGSQEQVLQNQRTPPSDIREKAGGGNTGILILGGLGALAFAFSN